MRELIVDPEFKDLIPPLTEEEHRNLKNSLLDEGCRDALVVWGNILVDGYNRYKICQKNNIPFKTIQKDFKDRDEVKLWMMHNQLARRNLTELQRIDMVRKCESAVKAKAKERQGTRVDINIPEKLPVCSDSRDELGKLAGVSGKTYEHGVAVLESAPKQVVDSVLSDELSINKAYQVTQATPEQQAEIAQRLDDINAEPKETNTPKKVVDAVLRPHVANNGGNNEWYTPADYIELAKDVMGTIDLDPASSDIANEVVHASHYYTAETNGLKHEWYGNVWLNPPYAQPIISQFVTKLIDALPTINNAIVLVNNATETEWFKKLVSEATAVCFTYGRVKFYAPDGKIAQPLQGQAVLYFGADAKKFIDVFSTKGWCAYPA